VAAERPSRADAGLPDDGMVFCCFNGAHKITRASFARWMTILDRVPGSVLWLLDGAPATNERMRGLAAAAGIAPQRLVFAPKLANAAHLARYPLADLFLDTTPYGAHTTASDALWMGVPVLTWSGRSFAARVCGSLVRAAGLPELVCASAEDYVDRAIAFGRDPARLARYRERLAVERDTCTLFDTPQLVRAVEALYRGMWEDFESGRLPVPDLANLDAIMDIGRAYDHEAAELQAMTDYDGHWRAALCRRHALRPLVPTGQVWDAFGTQ
jgi:predicted O-linked N-acetylglucosamine transferase (SPINDLY family)